MRPYELVKVQPPYSLLVHILIIHDLKNKLIFKSIHHITLTGLFQGQHRSKVAKKDAFRKKSEIFRKYKEYFCRIRLEENVRKGPYNMAAMPFSIFSLQLETFQIQTTFKSHPIVPISAENVKI